MIDPVTALALGVKPIATDFAAGAAASAASSAAASGSGTFAEVLTRMGDNTINKLNDAEKISMDALRGNAGPREVAEAVMGAELALQTSIAVRDKVVTAYLEVSRMAI